MTPKRPHIAVLYATEVGSTRYFAETARDYRTCAEYYERLGVSFEARALHRLTGVGRYGDLRDRPAIIAWSTGLGDSLGLPHAPVTVIHP
ncbi:hypothetical protein ABZV91_07725 [Nocardia sp. NPDC004568]|uniref:hypothetical protein n=1 Tax=Nocardia sp. NPDC004568 TaxID=3154551 RepID=UPI00339E3C3A